MPLPSLRWSETWRVLAYTVAIALAFIALGRLEMALFSAFGAGDALARGGVAHEDAALARQAEDVAVQSRAALERVPGRRALAFRLGYDLGFASAFIGSYAMSAPDVQAKARAIGERHLALARQLAEALGIAGVAELPVKNPKEYATLNERFEADENGLAAEIEKRLSPAHRHLYLLGAQVGGEASTVESSGGELTLPPVTLIRRHATLAGVAPELWLPLATAPRGQTPAQVLARYRTALNALAADLAARDEGQAPSSSAPSR
jgi:hypothetical protein